MAADRVVDPFIAFNFRVEIKVPGVAERLCEALFSECDGLEMNAEHKTIREGGNNGEQVRLPGPLTLGTLTLKRGMTETFDLWNWFDAVALGGARALREDLRPDAEVVLLAPDRSRDAARFTLRRCLPLKLRAPALNAVSGLMAIEEFQLAYESLSLRPGEGAPRA